jgi:hypothetical protein
MRPTRSFVLYTAALVAAVLMAATPGWGQPKDCRDFRAIWLGSITFVGNEAHWGGTVVAAIDEEVLEGTVSTVVIPFRKGTPGVVGMDRGTQYLYDFGNGDTFTLELQSTGVFPNPPGKSPFGYYRDVSRIIAGTGRFAFASGNIVQMGPFLVWFGIPGDFSTFKSLYTPELHGRVCLQ